MIKYMRISSTTHPTTTTITTTPPHHHLDASTGTYGLPRHDGGGSSSSSRSKGSRPACLEPSKVSFFKCFFI